ncbi:MAG: ribosome recycling factor [Spirochaetales bacterium]|jgi:ribosome recycling factor|nr:ribosome recycling factor [Spirochaetales bacterium]
MSEIIDRTEDKMKKSIAALGEDLKAVRAGRASPALVDQIKVHAYNAQTPLNQVATISAPEARLLVIQPWDKSLLHEIEKAIQKSELSVNPSNDGKVIRLNIPPLNEQRRSDLIKSAKAIAEQSRVAVRNIRRDANEDLKKESKAGRISEDQEKQEAEEVQKLTDKYIKEINGILQNKEAEITEI